MLRGQILALFSALFSAMGVSLFNRMGERLTSDMIGYARIFIAVPLSLILVFIFDGKIPLGYSWPIYAAAFGSGFVGYFLCDYFMFKAIVGLGARETSVIMTLNPVLTAVISLFIFNEVLDMLPSDGWNFTRMELEYIVDSSTASHLKTNSIDDDNLDMFTGFSYDFSWYIEFYR